MKPINFYISFDHFKFKDIKEGDYNNFEKNFIYNINLEFNDLLKNNNNDINKFHSNLFGKNNNLLFYTGIESKVKDKMKQYENKILNTSRLLFDKKNKLDENLHYIKIKIGKNRSKQQYSLSCILVILNYRNNEIEMNGFENLRFYLLFPIRCGDFH